MKKYFFTFIMLTVFSGLYAQNWQWVKNYMHGAEAWGKSIGTDGNGNIYITGSTEYFSGGEESYYYELFWKADSEGNLLWVDTLSMWETQLITDSNGFSYIAGGNTIQKFDSSGQQVWSILQSGYITGIAFNFMGEIQVCSYGYIDGSARSFVTKIDTSGNLLWTKISDIAAAAYSITCDLSGNSYVAGSGYLFKYSFNGDLLFTKAIPYKPEEIAFDKNGSLYIIGIIYGTVNINGTSYSGGHYLIKFDENGNILWYKIITGGIGYKDIGTDTLGNLYLAISKSSVTIDTLTVVGKGLVVVKIDSVGIIKWHAKTNFVSGGFTGSIFMGDILVKSENEVLITGAVDGFHQFGNFSTIENIYSLKDLFIAKIISQPVSLLSTAFSADKYQICSGDIIQFSDSSTGNPTAWQWYFEGGNPSFSTVQNPAVIYDQPGTYFVKLVVSDSIKSDSLIINNYITVNALPIVDLGDDTTLPAGISLILDAASTGSAASGFEYLWSTGDTNQTITVSSSSNYSVSVTNQNGCTATDEINVFFTVSANFTSDKIQVCAGDSVSFIDSSNGNPSNWNWLFEGGTPSSSTAQNPTVIYSQPGTYFVKLTVNDTASSDSLLMTSYITVFPLPTVNLGPDTILESGASIILDAENSGSQYYWSTGDTNQTIEISLYGIYSVTVSDQNACTATDDIFVDVDSSTTTTSSAELLAHSSFNIYPNPATGSITINYYSKEPAELMIRVRDFSGKLIYEENKIFSRQYLKTIDLSAHAIGTYFIEIVNGNESIVEKIIIE